MAVLYKIRLPDRAANFMNHGSLPVGDKHYNKIWLALHVTFVDQPIELLCHQNAGQLKRSAKLL